MEKDGKFLRKWNLKRTMKTGRAFIKKNKMELLLVLMVALICTIFLLYYGTFGAAMDWLSQHSVFPDYFRRRFYETGQLFPSLALQLGGGENIYRDSYYGLYSPIYLLSYLLPFVKMSDYVIAVSMLNIAVCAVLLYRFFLSAGMSEKLSVWGACIYVFATPVIYHAYVHCMFVNYMPFLIMGLFGVQKHLRDGKSGLLIISTFLMVMTSFYFSIGGMLVLTIYAVHYYILLEEERITWKGFLTTGFRYAGCILLAVLMSAVLLLPTAQVLSGRSGNTENTWTLLKLLTPTISIKRFVYAQNGLGLTSLVFVVLFAGIFSKKLSNKVFYIVLTIMLFVPVFCVLLNGGLYAKSKVFIPFIPIVIYGMLNYLKSEVRKKEHHIVEVLPYVANVVLVYAVMINQYGIQEMWQSDIYYVLVESLMLLVLFLVYYRIRKPWILVVPTLLFMVCYSVLFHLSNETIADAELVSKVTDRQLDQLVDSVTSKDEGWYRMDQLGGGRENAATLNRVHGNRQYITSNYTSTYDEGYLDFRTRIFDLEMPFRNALMESATRNPVFLELMGVKYIISTKSLDGFELVKEQGDFFIYENPYAAPIMYGTNRYLSESVYDKLTFPYNQIAFTNYAVISNPENSVYDNTADFEKKWRSRLRKAPLTFRADDQNAPADKKVVKEIDKGYEITAKGDVKLQIPLGKKAKKDTVYFLRFTVKNLKPNQDMKITVGGAANKVSDIRHQYYNENTVFTYAVYVKEGQRYVNVTLGPGHYQIWNPIAYYGKMSKMRNEMLYQDAFTVDWEQTKGDYIAGSIKASTDEKMITSIPYDEGYTVYIDGRQVDKEIVNKTFLGFDLPKGEHEIRIEYLAPGLHAGMAGSALGIVIFIVVLCFERKKRR